MVGYKAKAKKSKKAGLIDQPLREIAYILFTPKK